MRSPRPPARSPAARGTPTATAPATTAVVAGAEGPERARPSGRWLDQVPGAAHRVDHRLAAGVDLAAPVGDVELDDVALAAEVVLPHAVEDVRLRQHPLRVAHQVPQQLELGGGEPDVVPGPDDLVALLV